MILENLQNYSKELATLFAVVLAFIVARIFRPKAKIAYSVRHAATIVVPEPLMDKEGKMLSSKQFVHTASISVANLGIEKADNVEIVFNWKPQFLNVWPSRFYEEKDCPDGRYSVVLSSLAPAEVFGAEILSINRDLPGLNNVRSDQSDGEELRMIPQVVQPAWKVGTAVTLMFIGFAAAIYLLILSIQILSKG